VVVTPVAYNCSTFAYGYSSFGGYAFSGFSFAYSTRRYGFAFGWTSAPCYSVYTPVYDPFYRAVWVPGCWETVYETVWIPGRYEEVIRTPVTELITDPLGNTYEAVIEPGSVDYEWIPGRTEVEPRSVWRPGRFDYVAL
jgi:hypothetical protein